MRIGPTQNFSRHANNIPRLIPAGPQELGELVDPSIEEDIEDGKNKINLIRRQKSEICLSDSHLINGI